VEPDVVQYLLQRLERSFSEARRIVAVLDEQALAQKRNITIPLVRDIMNKKQEL
jgi:chromosomal replication initiation ATPase DnaA